VQIRSCTEQKAEAVTNIECLPLLAFVSPTAPGWALLQSRAVGARTCGCPTSSPSLPYSPPLSAVSTKM